MLKVSNIVEENKMFDSQSYKELSPVMKKAVNEVFKSIDLIQKDILNSFENSVEKIAELNNVNKKELFKYFDNEVNEQLGE
jgi:chromosome condensin MukBEF complex kleisin-like MukF subunit